ncbi:AMP-binding enzyme C-terminal domain-containing protein [Streptomyces sp. Ncost-T10-10d]|nr:AMP-binding enzyme C-terminal domain-containing protein [Streptomyces sp. Ncost-T10-10d]
MQPTITSSVDSTELGPEVLDPQALRRRPRDPALRQAYRLLGPVLSQHYGQAEAPNALTVLDPAEHRDDPTVLGSCGRPMPGVEITLRDPHGREVPAGEPGELCVRGPLVMDGYWNKPEQTAAALEGGRLHTGDVARRDDNGLITIIDRIKDTIITGGFNVYPREVEDTLATHRAVAAVAVYGTPDPHWGEAVTAAVVLHPGQHATPANPVMRPSSTSTARRSPGSRPDPSTTGALQATPALLVSPTVLGLRASTPRRRPGCQLRSRPTAHIVVSDEVSRCHQMSRSVRRMPATHCRRHCGGGTRGRGHTGNCGPGDRQMSIRTASSLDI